LFHSITAGRSTSLTPPETPLFWSTASGAMAIAGRKDEVQAETVSARHANTLEQWRPFSTVRSPEGLAGLPSPDAVEA
jgi:hypothetical protein